MEFLQLVAAAAVDRTRKQATAAAAAASTVGGGGSWMTGWRESPGGWETGGGPSAAAEVAADPAGTTALPLPAAAAVAGLAASADVSAVVDDGYRNTEEFLRARLRIGAPEAKRRLCLARGLLPRPGLTGIVEPPVHAELGAAVAAGEIASRSASIITAALDRVRHLCDEDTANRMEHTLTRTAAEHDPDFLARVARGWTEALDTDGAEPSEELLRRLQGAFIRPPRGGLQHLEIYATTEQFEHLLTVMNTATNPRTTTATAGTSDGSVAVGGVSGHSPAGGVEEPGLPVLDLRSRPQKLLDGMVGACKVALAAGGLPATGGLRPQIMATIDYRDLLTRLQDASGTTGAAAEPADPADPAGTATSGIRQSPRRPGTGTGSLLFTGPVTAATIRKIACDADIIPVLLGGDGQVLDIGRASRVFPPHIRKALTARDHGCAFPGCTIPAPWCEAHHITYWSRGGTTGTNNGTLLCSHHHHLIHKEHWTIHLKTGIPWFIPPPHIDPQQHPRRNHYFRPTDHP
ncbi:DUF222 domain-containing protein [Arthrobacter sp. UYCu712]|uniref:HNH endonuclease n=1 Tax=Arthrobacter sp. UYCu712 TaxID=3156340 RepID=UPI003392EDC4